MQNIIETVWLFKLTQHFRSVASCRYMYVLVELRRTSVCTNVMYFKLVFSYAYINNNKILCCMARQVGQIEVVVLLREDERLLSEDERLLSEHERLLSENEHLLSEDERLLSEDEHLMNTRQRCQR